MLFFPETPFAIMVATAGWFKRTGRRTHAIIAATGAMMALAGYDGA
jgi:hypothetical protein